jgi:hypothetical protein
MSDLAAAGEPVHSGSETDVQPVGRTNTGWSALACMETIMSKTNDTSKLGHATFENRPLDSAELNAVTGGLSYEEFTFEYTERTLGGRLGSKFGTKQQQSNL